MEKGKIPLGAPLGFVSHRPHPNPSSHGISPWNPLNPGGTHLAPGFPNPGGNISLAPAHVGSGLPLPREESGHLGGIVGSRSDIFGSRSDIFRSTGGFFWQAGNSAPSVRAEGEAGVTKIKY